MKKTHQEKRLKYNNQRSTNRPSHDDFVLINVKVKPEDRKAFRMKCVELDLIGSDLVRDFIVDFTYRDARPC